MTTKIDYRVRVAIHEAAHAVAFMHCQLPVDDVVARKDSGFCLSRMDAGLTPQGQMLVSYAGGAAEDYLCGVDESEDPVSDGDHFHFNRGARGAAAYGVVNARREYEKAESFVAQHEEEILTLANVLLERGRLKTADMAVLCYSTPALKKFRHLYISPLAKKRKPKVTTLATQSNRFVGRNHNFLSTVCNSLANSKLVAGTARVPRGMTHQQMLSRAKMHLEQLKRRGG